MKIKNERKGQHEKMLTLRRVLAKDCRILWKWVNDPLIRASAFQSEHISWKEHVAWFKTKSNDPRCHMYIVEYRHTPIGQVRFEIDARGAAIVDISLNEDHRHRGLGSRALRYACDNFLESTSLHTIAAYIKPHNGVSIRTFEKAGFIFHDVHFVKKHPALSMTYSSDDTKNPGTRNRPIRNITAMPDKEERCSDTIHRD